MVAWLFNQTQRQRESAERVVFLHVFNIQNQNGYLTVPSCTDIAVSQ